MKFLLITLALVFLPFCSPKDDGDGKASIRQMPQIPHSYQHRHHPSCQEWIGWGNQYTIDCPRMRCQGHVYGSVWCYWK